MSEDELEDVQREVNEELAEMDHGGNTTSTAPAVVERVQGEGVQGEVNRGFEEGAAQAAEGGVAGTRAKRLLQTHTPIGQEVQLPSFDWTRAAKLYLLSNQSMSL